MTHCLGHIAVLVSLLLAAGDGFGATARNASRPPWFGFGFTYERSANSAQPARGWLLVRRVTAGGPSDVAGLRAQDVVLAIDDRPLTFANDVSLLEFIGSLRARRVYVLTVIRGSKRLRLNVMPIDMPDDLLPAWEMNLSVAREKAHQETH